MGMCIHTIACMWNVIQLSPGTSGVSLPLQRRTGIQLTPFPGTVRATKPAAIALPLQTAGTAASRANWMEPSLERNLELARHGL